ncbi:MAG: hypothetical protein JW940_37730 [Polyangiaceae bacterium]|nr:hypothetical protein [Polyangiaceae bacterium]
MSAATAIIAAGCTGLRSWTFRMRANCREHGFVGRLPGVVADATGGGSSTDVG